MKDYEPHLALDGGEDGLDFYRAISEKWKAALAPGGRLYFEVGIGQADARAADHARPGLWRHSGGEGPPRHPPRGVRHPLRRDLQRVRTPGRPGKQDRKSDLGGRDVWQKRKPPLPSAAPAEDKKRAIEAAMGQIEKMYGKGSIMRLGDQSRAAMWT